MCKRPGRAFLRAHSKRMDGAYGALRGNILTSSLALLNDAYDGKKGNGKSVLYRAVRSCANAFGRGNMHASAAYILRRKKPPGSFPGGFVMRRFLCVMRKISQHKKKRG